jgi:hypothetical protein
MALRDFMDKMLKESVVTAVEDAQRFLAQNSNPAVSPTFEFRQRVEMESDPVLPQLRGGGRNRPGIVDRMKFDLMPRVGQVSQK